MPSSRGRREGERREAVGARLGVDGAEGWQGRARPQVGADGTPAVQGHPFLLPLAAPVVPWPSGNSNGRARKPSQARCYTKWERDEDIFSPL